MLLGRPYALASSDTSSTTATATLAGGWSTPTCSSIASSIAAPAKSTSSSTSSPSSDTKSIRLGVRLGLGLGLLLMALMSFLIFRERKRRTQAEQTVKSVVDHQEMDSMLSNLRTPDHLCRQRKLNCQVTDKLERCLLSTMVCGTK